MTEADWRAINQANWDERVALLSAGLTLTRFTEHDVLPWQGFDCLARHEDGFYRWPDEPWLPLSYALRAAKLGSASGAGETISSLTGNALVRCSRADSRALEPQAVPVRRDLL